MLVLDGRQTADAGTNHHADAERIGPRFGVETALRHRLLRRLEGEQHEAVLAARGLAVAAGQAEVVQRHLPAEAGLVLGRVQHGDGADAVPASLQCGPEIGDVGAIARQRTHPGHDDPTITHAVSHPLPSRLPPSLRDFALDVLDDVADGLEVLVLLQLHAEGIFEIHHDLGDVQAVGAQVGDHIARFGDGGLVAREAVGNDVDDLGLDVAHKPLLWGGSVKGR